MQVLAPDKNWDRHVAQADLAARSRDYQALRDRVLESGGRIVLADMMSTVGLANARNRELVKAKSKALLEKGPAGAWRLLCNGARFLAGRWERPESGEWWRRELEETGFAQVQLELTDHEGGIVEARR